MRTLFGGTQSQEFKSYAVMRIKTHLDNALSQEAKSEIVIPGAQLVSTSVLLQEIFSQYYLSNGAVIFLLCAGLQDKMNSNKKFIESFRLLKV